MFKTYGPVLNSAAGRSLNRKVIISCGAVHIIMLSSVTQLPFRLSSRIRNSSHAVAQHWPGERKCDEPMGLRSASNGDPSRQQSIGPLNDREKNAGGSTLMLWIRSRLRQRLVNWPLERSPVYAKHVHACDWWKVG